MSEDRTQAFDQLNRLLSSTSVPKVRRSKPKWIIKHLKPDTEGYQDIVELCESIVQRGWA